MPDKWRLPEWPSYCQYAQAGKVYATGAFHRECSSHYAAERTEYAQRHCGAWQRLYIAACLVYKVADVDQQLTSNPRTTVVTNSL